VRGEIDAVDHAAGLEQGLIAAHEGCAGVERNPNGEAFEEFAVLGLEFEGREFPDDDSVVVGAALVIFELLEFGAEGIAVPVFDGEGLGADFGLNGFVE